MKRLLTCALVLTVLTGLTGVATAEPLKIRYSIWVGYGPLFIAKEKGYFKEEKVDVELVNIEDPKEGFFALAANRLDGVVSTVDTMVLYLKTALGPCAWRSRALRRGRSSRPTCRGPWRRPLAWAGGGDGQPIRPQGQEG